MRDSLDGPSKTEINGFELLMFFLDRTESQVNLKEDIPEPLNTPGCAYKGVDFACWCTNVVIRIRKNFLRVSDTAVICQIEGHEIGTRWPASDDGSDRQHWLKPVAGGGRIVE
ncbi:hypothetical protein ACTXT7_004336 [Hymenolepis weldensis]